MKRATLIEIGIPATVFLVIATLVIAGVSPNIERRGFDALLHLRPAIAESPHIRIIQIDDNAITLGGFFPWNRQITAKGILLLKELGAKYVTLDIEFLEKSALGVNAEAIKSELPNKIRAKVEDFKAQAIDFVTAFLNGQFSISDAKSFLKDYIESGNEFTSSTVDEVKNLVRDNDILLANSYKIFGNVGGSINLFIPPPTNPDADFLKSLINLKEKHQVSLEGDIPFKAKTLYPPISILTDAAKMSGFTNAEPDADGVKRRIGLIVDANGQHYAGLLVRPLLDSLGNPPIIFENGHLRLQVSKVDQAKADINIPVDSEGKMLINWTHNPFEKSFGVVSFANLIELWNFEQTIGDFVGLLDQLKVLENFEVKGVSSAWNQYLVLRDQALSTGSTEVFEEALALKSKFFSAIPELLAFEPVVSEIFEKMLNDPKNATAKDSLAEQITTVKNIFLGIKNNYATYSQSREMLAKSLKDTMCIIGQTGTGTSDIGITPFESKYMNVGLHANVVNTILQQNFLQESPPIVGLFLTMLILAASVYLSRRLLPLQSALFNFALLVGFALVISVFFIITGIYLGLLVPSIAMLISSIGMTLLKFRTSDKEKGFIRNAFARYLSDDVIKQIVSDPKSLNLGGAKKELTAIFTDVKGFSTISEKLDPSDLVKLLNEYLTVMSDIILDSEGFIDKYEGDAIIGFWGAPVFHADHAKRACISALRMKVAEVELNKRVIAEGLSPTPLLTRIGINTGDMVVGNMGTNRRLNYTIMGNAVNLAARLEGVNKKYGTWILISETTRNEAGDDILYRRLDRVRVVGINTPVRLYEVVAEKASVDAQTIERIEGFEKGLTIFEEKKWEESKAVFEDILKKYPDDEPSKLYLSRAKENLETPPPSAWDGVYNLTEK